MRKPLYCLVMVLLVSLMLCGSGRAAGLINPEAASSSEQAAKYQVRAIYEGTDLRIVQFYLGVLSHYSYLLISDGKVLAVDPGRDVKTLLDYAAAEQLDWVGTFLTHLHADFVAGHIEMALATGRPVYAGHLSAAQFPHIEVRDGSNIEVGKALIRIIETPGHTPEALCGLVMASANHQKHEYLFSGDSLFNGGPGRPDLIEGSHSAAELASMMFDTWNKKLALLKDNVVLLPAHDAGFFKRSGPGDLPSSTIGQERK
ncbi:MAG: MBL fold metallo-hydrolase, partial [Candidatus Riflebacteria bacterium]|nr:MBL fold metallo-hydrolase [Candidatus Riflebacteria bacterium]